MVYRALLLLITAAMSVSFSGCDGSGERIRERFAELNIKQELTVVVLGDSVSGGRQFSITGTSYSSFLKPKLQALVDKQISMINSSEEDETFSHVIRRVQEDVLSYRPDVVFVMLGLVDATNPQKFEYVFQRQVDQFMEAMIERNLFIVVLTTTPYRDITNDTDPLYKRLVAFNDVISYSARLHSFPVIDIFKYMDRERKKDFDGYRDMFSDPLHLNEKGQQFVADCIYREIAGALEKME